MKRVLAILLSVLLLAGALASCVSKTGDLKKGTITKEGEDIIGDASSTEQPAWRTELDTIYEQKLAATKAFAEVPKPSAGGTTYYISSINGKDTNDGKSPTKAWKTPEKASAAKSGDVVLFECGSAFRRATNKKFVAMKSGVTYATYGTGAKPIFYGSYDVSGTSNWVKVGTNLYKCKKEISISDDVGSIIFDNGRAWGIKIQMTYEGSKATGQYNFKTLALKNVSNGLETFDSIDSYSLHDGTDLKGPDLCFYHDAQNVYLYSEGGNPGSRFSSIELSQGTYAFDGTDISNVTILNLDFRNFGNHVIRTVGCTNLTVKNCAFTFIGGTVDMKYGNWRNYDTRLGNAIENWNECNGMTIENCFFDQIFDTAMTTQSNSAVSTQNVTYRNNVAQNMWFGVELWTTDGQIFRDVDVSGNYFKNIGEGFTTQRPDKVDPGTSFSVNAFIKVSSEHYQMSNFSVTDNIADGTNGKMVFCTQLKTNSTSDGVVFDRNTYVGSTDVDFARFFGKLSGTTYKFNKTDIAKVQEMGVETNGKFYYVESTEKAYEELVQIMPTYTYKAKNKVTIPFRLFFPAGYTAGESYPLVTFLNQESASGTDNLKNVTDAETKDFISQLVDENKAIILVPQCPSGTWTGLDVGNGNYSTASIAESEIMRAVAAMIRDVAEKFGASTNYAIGVDAGAYAVSDLLARHSGLLAAGIVIAGAGDPEANIGIAEVMVIHSENDDVVAFENAESLAENWGAKLVSYNEWKIKHNCWDRAAKDKDLDLLGWLLSK